jgi:hypothetical protein
MLKYGIAGNDQLKYGSMDMIRFDALKNMELDDKKVYLLLMQDHKPINDIYRDIFRKAPQIIIRENMPRP